MSFPPKATAIANIIYDLDHKLFTDYVINYVMLKCNMSDYVRQ